MTGSPPDLDSPERRRALITGGSRGIGREIALVLARQGHDVAVAARSSSDLATTAELAAESGASGSVVPVTADVGEPADCRALPGRATEALGGPIDIFVHAAGVVIPAPIKRIELEDWNTTMAVNVTAALLISQGVVPSMVENRWGRIVTIGSLYSRVGAKFSGTYAASKHAVLGLTRVLSLELASSGITANCVLPGFTDTKMMRDEVTRVAVARGISEEETIGLFLRTQPQKRLVQPVEVAQMVRYLCSDDAGSVTGQALVIDGGAHQST